MVVKVLRLGHRPVRDKRISTHLALVARAFGAEELIYTGVQDKGFKESVEKVVDSWGGRFQLKHSESWKKVFKEFDGQIVHLSMYGEDFQKKVPELSEDLLVVVGGKKVPSQVFDESDFNLSVGNQPHSEVSALGVFLYEFFGPEGLYKDFEGAERKINPSARSKDVESLTN